MNIFLKYSRLFLSLATICALTVGCKDDEDPDDPQEEPKATITALNPDNGPVGTTVEIQGNNFNAEADDHVVEFNGTEAEILGVTDNKITVTVPEDAATGNVSLSTGGHTAEGPVFTVSEPEAGISFISPTSGVAGQQVRIHGHNFSSETDHSVQFNGSEAAIRSVTDNLIIVAVPEEVSTGMVTLRMGGEDYEGPEFTVINLEDQVEFGDGFGTGAGMGTLGQAFIYEGGGLNGTNALRLTPAKADRTGVAYYGNKLQVQEGFETTFEFRISRPGQPEGETGEVGADGFSFIIQNEGLEAYGNRGDAMGYGGISNTVVVEFDIFENEINFDPNGNHISVHANINKEPVHAAHTYSLGSTTEVEDLFSNETEFHTARIVYTPGTLQIYLDDWESPFEVEIVLEDYIDMEDGRAFVGFTASTNPTYGWASHDILSWTFQPTSTEE